MAGAMVIDNSVVMAWCFKDKGNPYARAVLAVAATNSILVPSIWPLEAGNTVLVAERRKRVDSGEASVLMGMLAELPFHVEQEPEGRMLNEIFVLAREHQLSTYDASYLDLAQRRGVPLATQVKSLRRAAGRCGVVLFQP